MSTQADARLHSKIKRELGPTVLSALNDPDVIEIVLNADGFLWVERLGETMRCAGSLDPVQAESAMKTIATCRNTTLTPATPVLSCELPLDGSRFQGLIPPVVRQPVFAIRKRAISVFTLDDYTCADIITSSQRARIEQAVLAHENIVVVGATGSGKTTLTNAIIEDVVRQCPDERLLIIEDTNEIQCMARNALTLRSSVSTPILALLQSAMRLRPDRILVGEVRGGEAWTLIKSWNTGHPGGVVTVHANDASSALLRLEQLAAEDANSPRQSHYLKSAIGESVDLVVHIARERETRVVKQLLNVTGYADGAYITQDVIS